MTDFFATLNDTVERDRLDPSTLFKMEGQVALVTGAAGGLGRWISAGLAAAGAKVAATDLDSEGLERVGADLDVADGHSMHLIDLSTVRSVAALVDEVIARHGRLDAVVNCAATNRRQAFLDVDIESYDHVMGLDVRMPFFLTQQAARAMAGRGGSIVHVTSTNAQFGLQSTSVYAVAKAGMSQLVRTTAVELAPHGVRVNALAPGFLMTPLSEPLWKDADKQRWILERVPMARPGIPKELVGACQLLCSEAGSFITGQTFVVDGGFLAGNDWTHPGPSQDH